MRKTQRKIISVSYLYMLIKISLHLHKGKYIYYAEGGGMKMLRGGTEIFSGIKGGALKVLDILKGGL